MKSVAVKNNLQSGLTFTKTFQEKWAWNPRMQDIKAGVNQQQEAHYKKYKRIELAKSKTRNKKIQSGE